MNQNHILAIHDISCMGRCSLTIAMPVISAAGIITSIMPTAVLSTHTGGFSNYTYRDLTGDMPDIAKHWQTLSHPAFDAIYTGYLGSPQQLQIVEDLISKFKNENTLIVIDPVMADHGKLYAGFSADFPQGMKALCEHANVISPNMTEALLMLGRNYQEGPYTEDFIEDILKNLQHKSRKVVLTGVYFNDKDYGAATYDNGQVNFALSKRVPGTYHGTGDLFASVLTAALVKGNTLNKATEIAVKFTCESILRTYKAGIDSRYGVNFEEGLKDLYGLISN